MIITCYFMYIQIGSLAVLICASVTLEGFSRYPGTRYQSAAEFLIFVGVVGMIAESALTVIRFFDIPIINQYFTLFGVGVSSNNMLHMKILYSYCDCAQCCMSPYLCCG